MTEEETIEWLSHPRTPVRREGAQSARDVAEAVTAYLINANELFEEAQLLFSHLKVPRAAALAVLGLEELAKVPMLANTFLRFELGADPEAWQSYWKSGGRHRAKQELILAYGQLVRSLFEWDAVHTRYLYRYYASETVLDNLDTFKQASLYVDLRQDGVHAPTGNDSTCSAFDYLLTFGQERADSFGSWHITEARSRDYLELALGRTLPAHWTSHYDPVEIRADLLYHATALSASQVPNYATFSDYVQQYRSSVPERPFEEALLSLCDLTRSRVERSQSLSFFYARYLNTYKLLLSLAHLKVVGTDLGRQLSERLLEPRVAAPQQGHMGRSPGDNAGSPKPRPDISAVTTNAKDV